MSFACSRCGKSEPRITQKPLGGKLGQEVADRVCGDCWTEWDELQLKIINEYRLNLAVPQHFDMLVEEMRNFLGLKQGASGSAGVTIDDRSPQTY